MNSYRIGQVVPSSNTTMETEIPRMLLAREKLGRERFTFHSSRGWFCARCRWYCASNSIASSTFMNLRSA